MSGWTVPALLVILLSAAAATMAQEPADLLTPADVFELERAMDPQISPDGSQIAYMARSPISKVGNVTTPTILITGEEDYRTPMSETEQFYGAPQIQGVDATMVRIPDASHGIASRSSNLIAEVQFILGWFDEYRLTQRPVS
jgi:dipeptidyl aminopeptidase/acylaminoacyl peptidase